MHIVPLDLNNIVWSNKHGFYYSLEGHKLAVCPNCDEVHICYLDNFDDNKDVFTNFNIWYQTANALDSLNSDIPLAVCSKCVTKEFHPEIPHQNVNSFKCEMCLCDMPSNTNQYMGIHKFIDTNCISHYICNLCANKNWKSSTKCLCGNIVHEVDMVHIKPKQIFPIPLDPHSDIHNYMVNNSYNFDETLALFVTKACKDCSTHTGVLNPNIEQKVFHSEFNPDNFSSVCYFGQQQDREIKLVESYYKNDNGSLVPSVYLVVKIINPGYVGYFQNLNDVF